MESSFKVNKYIHIYKVLLILSCHFFIFIELQISFRTLRQLNFDPYNAVTKKYITYSVIRGKTAKRFLSSETFLGNLIFAQKKFELETRLKNE